MIGINVSIKEGEWVIPMVRIFHAYSRIVAIISFILLRVNKSVLMGVICRARSAWLCTFLWISSGNFLYFLFKRHAVELRGVLTWFCERYYGDELWWKFNVNWLDFRWIKAVLQSRFAKICLNFRNFNILVKNGNLWSINSKINAALLKWLKLVIKSSN